jgi:hypothetical protein
MYRNSLFSKAIGKRINLITSEFPLLARCKAITYVSTSPFMYVRRSQSLLSKLAETLPRGKEQCYLKGRREYFR